MSAELAIVRPEQMAIDAVKNLANIVYKLRDEVFKKDVDYGLIPGTGDKPTLYLPGMEKLLRALNLRAEYIPITIIQDFDKPLFMYRYECRLYEIESGKLVSSAIGSANSFESKWRYRNASRICPKCGADAIIQGKKEYGGGFICYEKKGGCKAKFADNAPEIINQVVGRVENEDIFDQVNAMDKIGQKRSLSSAIKCTANVSSLYNIDLDDMVLYDTSPIYISKLETIVEGDVTEEAETMTTEDAKKALGQNGKKRVPAEKSEAAPDGVKWFNDGEALEKFATWMVGKPDGLPCIGYFEAITDKTVSEYPDGRAACEAYVNLIDSEVDKIKIGNHALYGKISASGNNPFSAYPHFENWMNKYGYMLDIQPTWQLSQLIENVLGVKKANDDAKPENIKDDAATQDTLMDVPEIEKSNAYLEF